MTTQLSLPNLNNTAVSRGIMIAARFAQRSRAYSSRRQVLNDMVQSMSDAIHNPTRVGYYRLDPSGKLHIDTANCKELLDESHVRGALPSGPLAKVIESHGFIYIPDILQPPKHVYLLDGNGNFVMVKPSLDRRIIRKYKRKYEENFRNGEKMDMVFGCLSVPGHPDRSEKIFGAVRADSFSFGKSILPAGMQPQELLSVFSVFGNFASQSLDELETRQEQESLLNKVRDGFRILKHDIGGRLTAPSGLIQMGIEQLQGYEDEDEVEVVEAVERLQRALRLLRIIPEKMKEQITRLIDQNFDIVIDASRTNVEELFDGLREMGLDVNMASNVPEEITTDKSYVLNVLIGLVENAGKYRKSEQEKAVIAVHCRALETGRELEISIVDQGLGLSREQIDEIFTGGKRFNELITGWGWGLYGFKKIVEKLGGRIWAESEGLGKGSAFRFTLPIT